MTNRSVRLPDAMWERLQRLQKEEFDKPAVSVRKALKMYFKFLDDQKAAAKKRSK